MLGFKTLAFLREWLGTPNKHKQQQRLAPPMDQRTNPFQRQLQPSMASQKNAHGWLVSHNGGLLFREGLWGNSVIMLCRRICWRDSKSPEFIVLQTPWNNAISNEGGSEGLRQKDATAKSLQLSRKIIWINLRTFFCLVPCSLPSLFFQKTTFFPKDYFFFQKTTFLEAATCMCVWQAHSGFRMTSLCFLKTEIIRDVKSNGWKWESRTLIKDWDHFGGPIGKSGRDFGMETGVGSLFVLSCWGSCNVTTAVEPVKVDVSNFSEWWPVCSQDPLLVGALWQSKENWKIHSKIIQNLHFLL